jgi:hypothetical protein
MFQDSLSIQPYRVKNPKKTPPSRIQKNSVLTHFGPKAWNNSVKELPVFKWPEDSVPYQHYIEQVEGLAYPVTGHDDPYGE